ncbi:4-hydroxy-3-methylbut-2-enyl diphosphate reductase [Thioalkalivibrio sp. ALM2T]|uniref:4-hydroxy-3-methylbut-2-enyl diphosphate reductase n=1 Tax=Thioalkalivibrio sp. ALM2T TaxID=1158184 RepID=UPI0003617D84|nr:4-hydroxy-3-methylbut-2-enyl diphosphate reductase [Thioalkalivibrio sp. ALM2T]
MSMQAQLANPRGFCAGVERAIEIVERALEIYGAPLYVRHEVVHNRHVVGRLTDAGVRFVDELDEVPDGQVVIFSAHGVPKRVQQEAEQRGLTVFDATCPLVTKVHLEVARYAREGREVVLIGHAGHPEVEGTLGQFDDSRGGSMMLVETIADVENLEVANPDRLAFVSQTTLSMDDTAGIIDALTARFPKIEGPRKMDICYATQNRQDAVKDLAKQCDLLLVVGSKNSSNSNRLSEIGARMGVESHLVDGAADIDPAWLEGKSHIGVTAGASAPEVLVNEVLDFLRGHGVDAVSELAGREETITFSIPTGLRRESA